MTSASGGDLTKLVDLTKGFIKAVTIKINPECPICLEDIAPGIAAACPREGPGPRHVFHLQCTQRLESIRRGRAVTCPVCRIDILQQFTHVEVGADDVITVIAQTRRRASSPVQRAPRAPAAQAQAQQVVPVAPVRRIGDVSPTGMCFCLFYLMHILISFCLFVSSMLETAPSAGGDVDYQQLWRILSNSLGTFGELLGEVLRRSTIGEGGGAASVVLSLMFSLLNFHGRSTLGGYYN